VGLISPELIVACWSLKNAISPELDLEKWVILG
jgi:hypothetical protein